MPIRHKGQSIYEMSEHQLKQALYTYDEGSNIFTEIVRILQNKTRIRHSEARNRVKIDEDFGRNNF